MRLTLTHPLTAFTALAENETCDCANTLNLGRGDFAPVVAISDAPATGATWHGEIGLEGDLTGDGRLIEDNALRWENLPIPLRFAQEDIGAHGGAQVVGRILTMTRTPNGAIAATGDFDLGSEIGREAARHVNENLTTGVSMDLDDMAFEIRIAGELFDEIESMWAELDDEAPSDEEERETDDEGRVTVAKFRTDDEITVITSARVRAATMVAIPAFAGAQIAMDEGVDTEAAIAASAQIPDDASALMASAAPSAPPEAWFSSPRLDGPTPLSITDEGQIYGHLAAWDTCHTGFADRCVSPPRSPSAYAYFHRGAVLTAEGTQVAVGTITMNTLHAPRDAPALKAAAHYENTGAIAAYVTAGEDAHGIWVSGSLAPDLSDDDVRRLRASPLSGDWRTMGGALELLGALAVNVPGFPIPRPQGLVASGEMTSLVASGMLAPRRVVKPGQPGAFAPDDLRYLKRLIARERDAERDTLAVQAKALAERVAQAKIKDMARTLGLTN